MMYVLSHAERSCLNARLIWEVKSVTLKVVEYKSLVHHGYIGHVGPSCKIVFAVSVTWIKLFGMRVDYHVPCVTYRAASRLTLASPNDGKLNIILVGTQYPQLSTTPALTSKSPSNIKTRNKLATLIAYKIKGVTHFVQQTSAIQHLRKVHS